MPRATPLTTEEVRSLRKTAEDCLDAQRDLGLSVIMPCDPETMRQLCTEWLGLHTLISGVLDACLTVVREHVDPLTTPRITLPPRDPAAPDPVSPQTRDGGL